MKQTNNFERANTNLPILTERLRIRKLIREDLDNVYIACVYRVKRMIGPRVGI